MGVSVKAILQRLGSMLGRRVRTPDGVGWLIQVKTEANGLGVDMRWLRVRVWYGSDNPQNGWIMRLYEPGEVTLCEEGKP